MATLYYDKKKSYMMAPWIHFEKKDHDFLSNKIYSKTPNFENFFASSFFFYNKNTYWEDIKAFFFLPQKHLLRS